MARKKRLYRIAVIPAALVAVGVAGATLSQADASQSTTCTSSGGLLSVATSALCAATTGVGNLLGGATGGATTPVTSAVTSVTSAATGTVGALTGSQQSAASGSSSSGSSGPSGSSGSTSSGSSTGSAGSAGGTVSTGSTGTTVSQPRSATAPSAAAAARAAALAAQRAAQVKRQQSLLAIPVKAASGQATSVQLGPSQTAAYRQAPQSSFWRTTPLSLLIAIAIGLAVGIGIVYAGWRNGDLLGRRKRRPAPRQYSRRPAEGTLVR